MLSDTLSGKKNNLDLLRLIAASAVIFGHAPFLTGQSHFDPVTFLSQKHDYSGSLAVKFFFFISGLLVTHSLLRSQSIVKWSLARILRVVPAFAVALILTAIVLLPLFSDQGIGIWATKEPYRYVLKNISAILGKGNLVFRIDGVFSGYRYPSPNGSIWTLPLEMKSYFLLGVLFLIGGFRLKYFTSILLAALLLAELIVPNSTPFFRMFGGAGFLLACFVAGVLAAIWSDRISLRADLFVGFLVVAVVTASTSAFPFFYCAALFYGSLLLSVQEWFLRFKPPCDISYGVYLYGWPSQMFIFGMWPWLPVEAHIVVALLMAAVLGWLSWTFIESRVRFRTLARPGFGNDAAPVSAG